MRALRDDLPIVLSFFSRFPIHGVRHGRQLTDAVWLLPLASVFIAAPAAITLIVFAFAGAGALAAGFAAVAVMIVTTGALHEDGFADCADGFFGGANAERRLEIMTDSRIGAYGTLALLCAVGLKAALLSTLVAQPIAAALVLVSSAAMARTVALYPWVGLPAAREGLASRMGRPSPSTFRAAAVMALAVTAVLMLYAGLVAAVIAAAAAVFVAIGIARLAERLVGGHTGDVIGATVIAADLAYLCAATMWLS